VLSIADDINRKKFNVERHLSVEELDQKIRGLKQDVKVLKKSLFIKNLYQDKSVEKLVDLGSVTKTTGYNCKA